MSQRKSPVVQHTLTGPRVPTTRGRGQRPATKANLYIANPDTDSDSDEPQRPMMLGSTPTPASQFGTRGYRVAAGTGYREEFTGGSLGHVSQNQNSATMPGVPAADTSTAQDRERQQQRQQIAKGLTVVTQPPTPGAGSPFMEGGAMPDAHHPPIHAQYHYRPSLGNTMASRITGIPLSSASSSSLSDPSIAKSEQYPTYAGAGTGVGALKGVNPSTTNSSASPLSAVSGSGSGSTGAGTGLSSAVSFDEGELSL
jgi:hypothetical protein